MILDWLKNERANGNGKTVTVGERLCVTVDGETAVSDSDRDSAYLLCAEGGTLPEKAVERYGLVIGDDGLAYLSETEATIETDGDGGTVATKAVRKAPRTRAIKPSDVENKQGEPDGDGEGTE